MRTFNYSQEIQNLLTPEIVQLLTCIHEHKGRQDLFLEANTDELKTLVDVAMIQSTGASNRIEGILTSDKRLEALVSQKAEPHNRSEQEIAGYREVLALIHENHDYISPAPNVIRQLHRNLYSYSTGALGGDYKNADNVIAETDAQGHQKARFIPIPAFQTADAMDSLCQSFQNAWQENIIDKLLLTPMFNLSNTRENQQKGSYGTLPGYQPGNYRTHFVQSGKRGLYHQSRLWSGHSIHPQALKRKAAYTILWPAFFFSLFSIS